MKTLDLSLNFAGWQEAMNAYRPLAGVEYGWILDQAYRLLEMARADVTQIETKAFWLMTAEAALAGLFSARGLALPAGAAAVLAIAAAATLAASFAIAAWAAAPAERKAPNSIDMAIHFADQPAYKDSPAAAQVKVAHFINGFAADEWTVGLQKGRRVRWAFWLLLISALTALAAFAWAGRPWF